jgi:uncharacterized membrane protein YfcA
VDWSTFSIAATIILGAAVISGITGFGFGLVSVPPLLMLYPPAGVLAISKILTLSTSWIVIVHGWRQMKPKMILALFPFAIIGMFLGVRVLKHVSADAIKLLASGVVVGFTLILLRGIPRGKWNSPVLGPISGFISGVMSTSTGLSGPPIVLYFTLRDVEVQPFRITIATYFIMLDLIGFPTLIRNDLVTQHDLSIALLMIPIALVGRMIGVRLAPKLSRQHFFRLTLGLLMVTGTIGVVSSVLSLRS